MRRALLVTALACCLADGAAAQCCGDCNGDGMVAINELITAVNNALTNCGAATPTPPATSTPSRRPTATQTPSNRCPLDLDEGGGGSCFFRGRFNRGCGAALDSALTTNGAVVIVAIDTQVEPQTTVFFSANVIDETHASLTFWSTDNFQTAREVAGTLELTENRSHLVIFPNTPPFAIDSCSFVQYDGELIGRSGIAQSAAGGDADAFDRVRAWVDAPIPDLAVP